MLVFGAEGDDTIIRAVGGEKIGTLITALSRREPHHRHRTRPDDSKEATDQVIDETLFEAEEKMERAVEHAKEEFAAIRTGRATPAMFSKIIIDYYGAPTPLPQMASIGIPEPRMVIIKPYDAVAARRDGEGDPRLRPRA